MGGIRLGGHATAALPSSLPYSILEEGDADGNYNIWRVIGGVPTRLTWYTDDMGVSPVYSGEMNNVRLSPDGSKVIWDENFTDDGFSVVDMVAADGSQAGSAPDRIYEDTGGNWVLHPSWHPDGDKIVLVQGDGSFGQHIYEATVPGAVATLLWSADVQSPTQRENCYRPHYSPDGTQIAFLVTVEGGGGGDPSRQGLWVMDADGSNDSLIRSFAVGSNTEMGYAYAGTQIAWSNDGEWIAFDTRAWGSGEQQGVYKIRPDGTDEMLLAEGYPSVAFTEYLVGHGAWVEDDSALILSLNSAASSGWTIVSTPTDGSMVDTELVADGFGPTATQNFERCYRNPEDNRIYWIWRSSGELRSCAIDGTDERTDHDITTPPASSSLFYTGTGIEWL